MESTYLRGRLAQYFGRDPENLPGEILVNDIDDTMNPSCCFLWMLSYKVAGILVQLEKILDDGRRLVYQPLCGDYSVAGIERPGFVGRENDLCVNLAGGQDCQRRRAACAINLAIHHGIQNEVGPIEVFDRD